MPTTPARTPEDIIGMIPHAMGFIPTDSLVIILVTSDDFGVQTASTTMRIDFDDKDINTVHELYAQDIVALASKTVIPDAIFAIVYNETAESDALRSAIDHIVSAFNDISVTTLGAWRITADKYFRIDDEFDTGTPMTDTAASPLAIEQIGRGSSPVDSPEDLVVHPVSTTERDTFLAETETVSIAEGFEILHSVYPQLYEIACADEWKFNAIPALITPVVVRAFDAILSTKCSRDAMEMILSFNHPDFPPEKILALEPEELWAEAEHHAASTTAARQIVGLSPEPPDIRGVQTTIHLLSAYVQWSTTDSTWIEAASVIAWFHWALGTSTMAQVWSEAALQCNESASLARMIAEAVHAGYLPAWLNAQD